MEPVKIYGEYITLQQFLKKKDLISSGGEAKFYLSEHPVLVNDTLENRRGRKLYPNDKIQVHGKEYVIK
ncbi:MAG: S4 domain-containing protein YaaA [Anaeroplasmataceae bacterium]|jgi:S4 domain protein YaaA|nr:S4 domain-containing protein YaaA [Anaeroplasmataceae bacterium]HRF70555.1 S4 domain-containing protein YaaA [Candidatus Pelethenecus sp.]